MEIAADAAGIGIRASGFRLKIKSPSIPLYKKGRKGGFFGPADLWRTAGYEIAASLSHLAMTGNHFFTGH
jgi:hypothetical protein